MTLHYPKMPWLCGLAFVVAQTGSVLPAQARRAARTCSQTDAQDKPKEDPSGQEEVTGGLTLSQQYKMALEQLDKLTPTLDADTRASLPAIREILRHWSEGEDMGPVEQRVVKAFGFSGRGGGALPSLDVLKKNVKKVGTEISSKAAAFKFVASESDRRGSKRGLVNLHVEDRNTVIVVVLTPTHTATTLQRAQTIADRMKTLSKTCPTWWSQMIVSHTPVKGTGDPLYFVATKQNPNAPIVTTDAAFARESGFAPPDLAKQLIKSMHDNIADSARALADPKTPAEKRWVAFTALQAADRAFDKKDLSHAETFYKQAIDMDANYLTPYLGLAELYLAEHDARSARDLLVTAQKLPKLSAEDKQDIKKMQARVK